MTIKNAEFITSSTRYNQCPPPDKPEIAFIGRSNVGKSSLINMLAGRKKLAKVSSKPGKTQLINHFLIDEKWYLVDLPGYGWAKVSKTDRGKWGEMIHDYLLERKNLVNIFVLLDSRLPPQPVDTDFIEWLGMNGIPFALVFTKADKQSHNKNQSAMARYRRFLKTQWETLPPVFLTSSASGSGKDELIRYIDHCLDSFSEISP
ncbi:MAG: ribosome biogenesis GTP-binding protein YihA/YsxC [Cyclobacteriaceae bacterium]